MKHRAMITFESTKYAAGLTIWGDFWDLRSLHSTIHEITDAAAYRQEITDVALGLAYEVRHAYQNDREEKEFGFDDLDKVKYRGSYILWPYLLLQVKLLREFASYGTLSKLNQSHLYLLEHGVEKALKDANAEVAVKCSFWFDSPFPITNDYYPLYVDDIAKQYILGPQGKARIKKLPKLLHALSPFSDEYKAFAIELEKEAKENNCSPYELHDLAEWPDFKV